MVSQPLWADSSRFEKCAWIMFSSPAEAADAVELLKTHRVNVPGPIDPQWGEPQVQVCTNTNLVLILI